MQIKTTFEGVSAGSDGEQYANKSAIGVDNINIDL